jgi:hypothetical protein
MLKIQEFAVEHNCRLVVTGDTKQHHSVQWGDALRILERSWHELEAAFQERTAELKSRSRPDYGLCRMPFGETKGELFK